MKRSPFFSLSRSSFGVLVVTCAFVGVLCVGRPQALAETITSASSGLQCSDSAGAFSNLSRDAIQFYNRFLGESGRLKFSKAELETLFSMKEVSESAGHSTVVISTESQRSLVASIQKRKVEIGESMSLKKYEESVLLPAFRGLAHWNAMEVQKTMPQADLDDLMQASMLGLLDAIRSYKSDSLWMLSTHAFHRMRTETSKVLAQTSTGFTLADTGAAYARTRIFMAIAKKFKKETGLNPTPADIAEIYNENHLSQVSSSLVHDSLSRIEHEHAATSSVLAQPRTSDAIAGAGERVRVDAIEMVVDDSVGIEAAYEMKQRGAALAELMMTKLNPYEQKVMGDYFGLHPIAEKIGEKKFYRFQNSDQRTLDEVARLHGVTRERIRQIIEKGKRRMKIAIAANRDLQEQFSDSIFWTDIGSLRDQGDPTRRPLNILGD